MHYHYKNIRALCTFRSEMILNYFYWNLNLIDPYAYFLLITIQQKTGFGKMQIKDKCFLSIVNTIPYT